MSDRPRTVLALISLMCLLTLIPLRDARAEGFFSLISATLKDHDRVRSLEAELKSAEEKSVEAFGPWYPTLSQTGNYGFEHQDKPDAANTKTSFYEYDLKLTQLLWDFGATNADIEKARLTLAQAQASYEGGIQGLIKEAATAYANLVRAHEVLRFARQSEENIIKQTGLEEARIEAGGGYSTDVLQAKTQLAGAEARRLAAEGSLNQARNRYRALFGAEPADLDKLEALAIDVSALPASIDDAMTLAQERNLDLLKATLAEALAIETASSVYGSKFFPKIEAVTERKWKRNVAGTLNHKTETLAKVEVTLPFNLGLVAINTLRAAQSDIAAQTNKVAEQRRTVEESVRNAWDAYKTAQATAKSRGTQAEIAGAFLELARQERAIGRRSLIDVLAGETNLINAQSDALSARTDILLAAFDLMQITATLQPSLFDAMPPAAEPVPGSAVGKP